MRLKQPQNFSWIPIGGLGEVGMNCMVFQFGKCPIAIDAGILFADANDFGIEHLHPDFEFLLREIPIAHWIITHGHEDHIGAVPGLIRAALQLGQVPPTLWAPPFAAALIREKLLDGAQNPGLKDYAERIRVFELDADFRIEDVTVFPLSVRHSTPQSCSLHFEWKNPEGKALRIFHSSDFKLDASRYEDGVKDTTRLSRMREKGVDFLFIDSTNAEQVGTSTPEKDLLPGLRKIIEEARGRVYVTLFSSNIYRIAALLKMAHDCGRYACLAGRSLQSAYRVARDLGILESECPDASGALLLDNQEIGRRAPEKQLIICSGSQGEFRSVLSRMANQGHPDFQLDPADTVLFSSKLIPGNEKAVSAVINGLLRSGARILWGDEAREAAHGPIHASGHAKQSELRELMEALQPKNLIPVHGELRQLRACAELARQCGEAWVLGAENIFVEENGSQLTFENTNGEWRLASQASFAPLPRTLRLENFSASSQDVFLKERKRMAYGGSLAITFGPKIKTQVQAAGFLTEAQKASGFFESLTQDIDDFLYSKFKSRLGQKNFSVSEVEQEETIGELARLVKRQSGVRAFIFLTVAEAKT